MNNKRKGIVLLMILAIMITLVGCGQKTDGDGAEGDSSNEISLAVWAYDSNVAFQAIVKGFEEKYDATVKVIDVDADTYMDKVTTMLASGDGTDVIAMKDVGSYVNYANKGQLLDLTSFEEALSAEEKANFGLSLDSYRTEDGKLYALPFRKDTYVLFYNKGIFDEAGIEYPGEMTWTEYQELAEKLTKGDNEAEKTYGAYHHTWFPIVQALAANQTDNDLLGGEYGFLADYYEIFTGMAEKGHSMDYATIKSTKTSYSSVFETEKTATMIMGSFYMSNILSAKEKGDTNVDWAMAPLPQREGSNELVSYGGPAGFGVNKGANNPELAQKFVEFAAGEEGAKLVAGIGATPAYNSEAIMDVIFGIDGMPQDDMSRKALMPDKNGYEADAVEKSAQIFTILGEEHDLIMVGDSTIEEGIAAMEKRIAELE